MQSGKPQYDLSHGTRQRRHPETTLRDVYSVSRLNREVKTLLERGFGLIWLEAEISNFGPAQAPATGICPLKDA